MERAAKPLFAALGEAAAAAALFILVLSIPILFGAKYLSFVRTIEPALFAVAAAVVAWQVLGMFRHDRQGAAILRGELGDGCAEVHRYRAIEAIRVQEREDEGTGFLLKLEDGRTLFLAGQLFYELEEERRFPCREFEVDWTPRSRWRLDLRCIGEYLPPSAARAAFPKEAWKRRLTPSNGTTFEGDFEAMKDPSWPMVSARPGGRAT